MRKLGMYVALGGCFLLALLLEGIITRPPVEPSPRLGIMTLGEGEAIATIPTEPPSEWIGHLPEARALSRDDVEDDRTDDSPEAGRGNRRRPPPAEPATDVDEPRPISPPPGEHLVTSEDRLWNLAEHFLGDGSRWPEIAALNGFTDANDLKAGTTIKIPSRTAPPVTDPPPASTESTLRTHRVGPGDTLSKLSERYLGTWRRWTEIRDLNELKSDNVLEGMVLRIPD